MKLKYDACSLIECQKLGIIPLFHEMFGSLYITKATHAECLSKRHLEYQNIAEKIQEFVTSKIVEVIDARGVLLSNLGIGEKELLAEAKHEKDHQEEVFCVTEDKKAKRQAIALNLEVLGIDYLLVEACLQGKITEEEFDLKIIALDRFHKLNLSRVTELRRYVALFKKKKGGT